MNADDLGYFHCVTQGILELARQKCVTATGLLVNSDHFRELASQVIEIPDLDIGVHLNFSFGMPITKELAKKLDANGGRFPSAFHMMKKILAGHIRLGMIEQEFRAQIERCLNNGLVPIFLNSHEHVHMFPPLFKMTMRLADEFRVPFIRFVQPDWSGPLNYPAMFRNSVFSVLSTIHSFSKREHLPITIGTSQSGNLTLQYFKRKVPLLKTGNIYELMCHPGLMNQSEVHDERILNFHHWEQEKELLSGHELKEIYHQCGIELTTYKAMLQDV